MADEMTTQADTASSTSDAPVDVATTEQPASTDTQAVEADAASEGEADTSLLGGDLKDGEEVAPQEEAPTERIVPEKYEIAIEGLDLDQSAIEEASAVFKEVGLTNDEATKLMPAAAKFRDRVTEQTLQQLADQGAQQKTEWLNATKADPDIGGGKLDETLHLAAKALDHFGFAEGSDFRKLLTETGFGNHPDMVRVMRGVGEMLSEDGFVRANAGNPTTPRPLHERLYPSAAKGA